LRVTCQRLAQRTRDLGYFVARDLVDQLAHLRVVGCVKQLIAAILDSHTITIAQSKRNRKENAGWGVPPI
jgi:hypothetical protein